MSSVGEKLRLERERRGVSLEEVAHATRISARYLEALEQDELSALPGSTFNKGFVRAYAEYLALDPEPLVQAYVEEEVTQTREGRIAERPDVVDEMRASIRRRPDVRLVPLNRLLWIAAPAAALLAVVAVAAWFAVPVAEDPSEPSPTVEDGSVTAPAVSVPEETVQAAPERETPSRAVERDLKTKSAPSPAPVESVPQSGTTTSVEGALATEADAPAETVAAPAERPAERAPAPARPAPEPATPTAPSGESPQSSSSPLAVDAAGVGTGIEARGLVGRKDTFEEGEVVVFWTRIVGGGEGDAIRHVWLREGRAVGSVSLPVNGPHWRTFSQRRLPAGSAGSWAAEVRDVRGELLSRQEFLCVRPGSAPSGAE